MLDYTSPQVGLDEIVFEYRNKDYGAYAMRKRNSRTTIAATIFSISLLTLALVGPLMASFLPHSKVTAVETVKLVEFIEPPTLDQKIVLPPPPAHSTASSITPQTRFITMEVVSDDDVTEDIASMDDLKDAVASDKTLQGDAGADPYEIPIDEGNGGKGGIFAMPNDEIMSINDISEYPGFPGGDEAMIKFLQSNITYPHAAIRAEKQGKVFLEILIEKDGTISEAKVIKGLGFGLDEEAARAVNLMPKWTAAKYNGNSVRIKMTIPISFSIASAD
jgi:protein TonB